MGIVAHASPNKCSCRDPSTRHLQASISAAMTPALADLLPQHHDLQLDPAITARLSARRRTDYSGTAVTDAGSITGGHEHRRCRLHDLPASRQQVNKCDGHSPCRLAAALTLSSPAQLSAKIRTRVSLGIRYAGPLPYKPRPGPAPYQHRQITSSWLSAVTCSPEIMPLRS
jgi:hypothetical protein